MGFFSYDYTFCSETNCPHRDCFRHQDNLPKGERMIISMAMMKDTRECPYYNIEDEEDEEDWDDEILSND